MEGFAVKVKEIKELLDLLNWTPEKLAVEMMTSAETVRRWLRGIHVPPAAKSARLWRMLEQARVNPQRPIRNLPSVETKAKDTLKDKKDAPDAA
jgi:transcriptional regulator with XRE-family HTH domain